MKSQTTTYTKHFSYALTWLFCIFCILLGHHMAFAQGSVAVTVTASPTSVTTPIGSVASFTATASAIPNPGQEWSVTSGPTYSWSASPAPASCNPGNQSTTTVSTIYNAPGTYSVQVTCTVSYVVTKSDPGQKDDGTTATISGSNNPALKVPTYAIGGPITGDTDVNYYCSAPSPTGSLDGSSGQPSGTTFSWSMSGPATLLDPNNPTSTWTQQNATYRGTSGSNPMHKGDVTATLAYQLNGVSAKSTYAITVHMPSSLPFVSATTTQVYYNGDPAGNTKYNGFDNYNVKYQIMDQYNAPMPSISWNEQWLGITRPSGSDTRYGSPASIGFGADAEGFIIDNHSATNYEPSLSLVRPNGVAIYSFSSHKFYVGSLSDGLGCLLLTHSNVTYSTTGVTNDQ